MKGQTERHENSEVPWHDEALTALDDAVRLDSRSALIYDVRGVVRALAGRAEDAVADFDKAIELDLKYAEAYANFGLVQLATGNAPGAVESLTQALELAPDFALAYNGRGGGGGVASGATNSSSYRLPSTALPGDRGGVDMAVQVVKGEPADMSEMFGGGASEKPAVVIQQEGLYSPFPLFCATPVTGK